MITKSVRCGEFWVDVERVVLNKAGGRFRMMVEAGEWIELSWDVYAKLLAECQAARKGGGK